MPTPSPTARLPRRLRSTAAPLLLAAVTAACAGAARGIAGDPMEPGRYSFDGWGQVTHQMHDRQETSTSRVTGVMEVSANGDVTIVGSGANCSRRGSGTPPARVNLSCGPMTINIGPGAGTARLRTQQRYSQQSGCEEYEMDAQGRPTGRCLRQSWRERQRSITITIPLVVVRAPDGD